MIGLLVREDEVTIEQCSTPPPPPDHQIHPSCILSRNPTISSSLLDYTTITASYKYPNHILSPPKNILLKSYREILLLSHPYSIIQPSQHPTSILTISYHHQKTSFLNPTHKSYTTNPSLTPRDCEYLFIRSA